MSTHGTATRASRATERFSTAPAPRSGAKPGPADTPFGRLVGKYRESFLLVEDATGLVVVDQHVVTLTRPDGKSVSTDVCVVLRFDGDGRITRLDEYVDSVAFAELMT